MVSQFNTSFSVSLYPNILYHSFFHHATKDFCRVHLLWGAEGDGTDWPHAWHIASGLPGRDTLSWIFWCFCRGSGEGMGDDGGAQLPSPIASLWAIFVGVCIHAAVLSKWQNPFINLGRKWPQNNSKIYLANNPVNLWLESSGGELNAREMP